MRKLLFITLFLLFCRVASASEALVLISSDLEPYKEALGGFRSSCGCTIREIVLSETNDRDVMKEIRRRPEVIVAIGIDSLRMVRGIKDIPIVYLMIPNPGSILSREENITGVSMHVTPERQLTVLHEVLPNVQRVGLLYDPVKTGSFIERIRDASKGSGVTVVLKEVHSPKDVPSAIQTIIQENINLLWILPDTTVVTKETVEAFLSFSLAHKIPLFTFSQKYLEMGAVMSVGIDHVDIGKQAGEMVRKILTGTKVSELPRSDARKAVLGLNLKTAKKIGITFNREALEKAPYTIE